MSAAAAAQALAERIKPLLAGHEPAAQGAVLAELLAIWLAGHRAGSPRGTERLRDELLALHIEAVREFLPLAHREIHGEDSLP